MSDPYRSAEVRPESTPLRVSWWSFATRLLLAGYTGAFAYVLFRYVANGWFGYAIAGLVGLAALAFANEIAAAKLGDCPRCKTRIEVDVQRDGYQCPSCKTFLERDRGRLLPSPTNRVSKLMRFGVEYQRELVLPDCCCVCTAPATRHVATQVDGNVLEVPYCADHSRGIAQRPGNRHVLFRSLDYATRVAEASGGQLAGPPMPRSDPSSRWLGFGLGLLMAGGAAGVYYGLAALESSGYVIVPTGLKGLVLWLCLKLFGRLWVTAFLATLAAGFFSMFLGSFKPQR